jgi:hypothetical protein
MNIQSEILHYENKVVNSNSNDFKNGVIASALCPLAAFQKLETSSLLYGEIKSTSDADAAGT